MAANASTVDFRVDLDDPPDMIPDPAKGAFTCGYSDPAVVYLRDMQTGVTTLITKVVDPTIYSSKGAVQGVPITGRFHAGPGQDPQVAYNMVNGSVTVAFLGGSPNDQHVFLYTTLADAHNVLASLVQVDQGIGGAAPNSNAQNPIALSADGTSLAFYSQATNLVAGGATDGTAHPFVERPGQGVQEVDLNNAGFRARTR